MVSTVGKQSHGAQPTTLIRRGAQTTGPTQLLNIACSRAQTGNQAGNPTQSRRIAYDPTRQGSLANDLANQVSTAHGLHDQEDEHAAPLNFRAQTVGPV